MLCFKLACGANCRYFAIFLISPMKQMCFVRNKHSHFLAEIFIFSSSASLFSHSEEGAQWLSGRVLDSRPKGRGFEPHRRHCVVVPEQDTFILA